MFLSLTSKLSKIFNNLTNKGIITESNIQEAILNIKNALIDADVALEVVDKFIADVEKEALGKQIIKSVSAHEMFTKIVHEQLVKLLSCEQDTFKLKNSVTSIMIIGTQGNGKTTTCAKLARYFTQQNKKTLLVSFDIHRLAAQEQLNILAKQNNIDCIEYSPSDNTIENIYEKTQQIVKNYQLVLYDTAGRSQINEEMMDELVKIKELTRADETLLVVDSMIGQNAANIAKEFDKKIGISGSILTKLDGDARGGAAISITYLTNKPIIFIGTGEKIHGLEKFNPESMASKILDMGDIVSLVDEAEKALGKEALTKDKIFKGNFSLNDYMEYISTTRKMGGIKNILKFLPGTSHVLTNNKVDEVDNKIFKAQLAIIQSMTKKERKEPDILNASRKKRIAQGSGTQVSEINTLLKQYKDIKDLMKKIKNNPSQMMNDLMGMIKGSMLTRR